MKLTKLLVTASLAVGLLIPTAASASPAPLVADTTATSQSVSREVASPAVSGRWCASHHFGFSNWSGLQKWLNQKYSYRAKTQVWQAPNDTSVWNTYCVITSSKAYTVDKAVYPSSITQKDGTRVSLRLGSKSGGYTIDIKRPGVSKLYKVHVSK